MSVRYWLLEPRPPFLLLTIALVLLGTVVAWFQTDSFNLFYFILALVGMLFAHICVNVMNDYNDYKSGIDIDIAEKNERTPFSGGSGILPAGKLEPKSVYKLGVTSILIALVIGIYFIYIWNKQSGTGWYLLPIMLIGGISAYFYSTHLAKWMTGEFFAGLNFGPLAILGAYFAQTGTYSWEVLVASLAPGILTANLLLLNEFPDARADEVGGRKHLVILLGKRKASKLYFGLVVATYLCIIFGVLLGFMPTFTLIGLFTIPIALVAVKGALENHDDQEKLIPALGANVLMVLVTQFLLAAGYVLAKLL